jgi:serine phosphatase RsbU (regulator of sigma subunit)
LPLALSAHPLKTADGIVEAMNEREEIFGFERLLALAREYAPRADAEELLRLIERAVREFAGKVKQHDDLTVIVVRARDSLPP